MRIAIKPPAGGERHRQVLIGRTGRGRLTPARRGHVLSGLNRWRAYNGMRFPTVAAARTWLKEQFADVDEPPPAAPPA
ncbi:MAG: hypothetical protein OXI15_02230 [Chromatiales bacterium]|nr:hypothetical protein [Chromatiales bacterium]